jgi:hypothetical protein
MKPREAILGLDPHYRFRRVLVPVDFTPASISSDRGMWERCLHSKP